MTSLAWGDLYTNTQLYLMTCDCQMRTTHCAVLSHALTVLDEVCCVPWVVGLLSPRSLLLGKAEQSLQILLLGLLKSTVSPLYMNLQVANFQRCECAPVCQLLYCTAVLFKVLYCKIKDVFFIFVCFSRIICVKSIIDPLQYSTI